MSQQTLSTPNKLTLSGDNAQAWKSFKQRFELYVLAAGYTNTSDAEKIALLLTIGGDKVLKQLGLDNDRTRRRLFETQKLTLDKAVNLCRLAEDTETEML